MFAIVVGAFTSGPVALLGLVCSLPVSSSRVGGVAAWTAFAADAPVPPAMRSSVVRIALSDIRTRLVVVGDGVPPELRMALKVPVGDGPRRIAAGKLDGAGPLVGQHLVRRRLERGDA